MQDLRLIEVQEREAMAFGIKEVVGTLVAGGILMLIGLFAYTKVRGNIDMLDGGTYINTTHYCTSPGVWNTTHCVGGTGNVTTQLPTSMLNNYNAFENVKSNVTSGFDLASIIFLMIAVAGIIGVIYLAFR